jgi:hypothetical protein
LPPYTDLTSKPVVSLLNVGNWTQRLTLRRLILAVEWKAIQDEHERETMARSRVVAKQPVTEVAAISIDNACASGRQFNNTLRATSIFGWCLLDSKRALGMTWDLHTIERSVADAAIEPAPWGKAMDVIASETSSVGTILFPMRGGRFPTRPRANHS